MAGGRSRRWTSAVSELRGAIDAGVKPDEFSRQLRGGAPAPRAPASAAAAAESDAARGGGGAPHPLLVLLDMNGTLLVRAKARVARDADLVHAKLHYYVRPGCRELVAALRGAPGVRLAFYTSMQRRNAAPILELLFGAGCLRGPAAFGLYDRSCVARAPRVVSKRFCRAPRCVFFLFFSLTQRARGVKLSPGSR